MGKNLVRLYVCAFLSSPSLPLSCVAVPKSCLMLKIERKNMVEYFELKSNYETWFSNKSDEMQINYAKLNKPNRRRKRRWWYRWRQQPEGWTCSIELPEPKRFNKAQSIFPIITIVKKADSFVIFIKWQTKWCSMTSGIFDFLFFYLNKMNKFNFFILWENSFFQSLVLFPSCHSLKWKFRSALLISFSKIISKSNLKNKKKFLLKFYKNKVTKVYATDDDDDDDRYITNNLADSYLFCINMYKWM